MLLFQCGQEFVKTTDDNFWSGGSQGLFVVVGVLVCERHGVDFQFGISNFATVRIVAGADIGCRAGKKDNAQARYFVLPVKAVEALLFGVISFVPIDDFFE